MLSDLRDQDLCAGTFCFSIPSMLLFLFSFPSVFPPSFLLFFSLKIEPQIGQTDLELNMLENDIG